MEKGRVRKRLNHFLTPFFMKVIVEKVLLDEPSLHSLVVKLKPATKNRQPTDRRLAKDQVRLKQVVLMTKVLVKVISSKQAVLTT